MSNKEIPKGPIAEDKAVDILIIGSGTGMAAALAAHERGLNSLIIEKTALVGGSTARSGGAFWIPANPVLKESGSKDTLAKAEKYLEAITGDAPKEPWRAFLKHGAESVELLRKKTPLKLFWAKGYSDYHPEEPGGDPMGRTCEARAFDINRLGEESKRLRPAPMNAPVPMPVTGYDYKWMNLMFSKPLKAFPIVFKAMGKGMGGMLIGKRMTAGGEALAAGLFAGVKEAEIPVWTNTSLIELIKEDDRITGAVVEQDGKKVIITATKGVVLAAGGFDHNLAKRQEYQSPSLVENSSLGSEENMGDGIFNPMEKLNAATAYMNESWWFPAVAPVKKAEMPQVMLAERSLPGGFIVNSQGKRFINEAVDYMSFGQHLLKREEEGEAIKEMWLIFDQKYRNSYILAGTVMPKMALPKEWYENGIAHQAESVEELAKKTELPKEAFAATFDRFNEMAAKGKDEDFHRGENAYDNYYGDPNVKPNPNLRPLKEDKLYAVKMVLADLGTCGGLVVDKYARVMTKDDKVIDGLYAIGNNAANLFGRVYPGAGGTIAQGLVGGYIAANHIADTQN